MRDCVGTIQLQKHYVFGQPALHQKDAGPEEVDRSRRRERTRRAVQAGRKIDGRKMSTPFRCQFRRPEPFSCRQIFLSNHSRPMTQRHLNRAATSMSATSSNRGELRALSMNNVIIPVFTPDKVDISGIIRDWVDCSRATLGCQRIAIYPAVLGRIDRALNLADFAWDGGFADSMASRATWRSV